MPCLGKEAFRWDAAKEQYECPQRQPLTVVSTRQQKEGNGDTHKVATYRCAPEHCKSCPQKASCTPNPAKGRTVQRSEFDDQMERVKQRMATEQGKGLYKLRKETVELGFADWKEHRKVRRFASRGQERAETQTGLGVLVHNLLVLQAHRDKISGATSSHTMT